MNDRFLPMQPTYGSKTLNSFPRVRFPACFAFCANEKHCSNEQESPRLLDDVIIPCVKMKRKKLELPKQAALIIMDVFKRQMSTPFLQKIASNNIQLVKVPPNLTHIYQPLDVTVNCAAKQFIKRKFVDWHVGQIVTEKKKGTMLKRYMST